MRKSWLSGVDDKWYGSSCAGVDSEVEEAQFTSS